MTTARGPACRASASFRKKPATLSKGAQLAADVVPSAENPTPFAQTCLPALSAVRDVPTSIALSRAWRERRFIYQIQLRRAVAPRTAPGPAQHHCS